MTTVYPGTTPTRPAHTDSKVAGDIARVLRQHGVGRAIPAVLTVVEAAFRAAAPEVRAAELGLTERALQVLRAIATGQSNIEIGRTLYLSEDTVKTYARRLYKKLGCRNRAHAVNTAWELGLLTRGRAS